jgi:hypothetical protein
MLRLPTGCGTLLPSSCRYSMADRKRDEKTQRSLYRLFLELFALTTTGIKILASCDAPEDDWDN